MTYQKHQAEDLATRPVAANAADKPSRDSGSNNRSAPSDYQEPHDANWLGEVTLRSAAWSR